MRPWLLAALLGVPQFLCATGAVHHNTTIINNTPQGPKGDPGPPGVMGYPGLQGAPASAPPADRDRLNAYLGAGLRVYDAQHWQALTYVNQDVWHGGTVVGAMAVLKLGKSYEEREIDRLKSELRAILGTQNPSAGAEVHEKRVIHSTLRGRP